MISLAQRYIANMAPRTSLAYIARESGVSYYQVLKIKSGFGTATSEQTRLLGNAFNRFAYNTLRNEGAPVSVAKQLSQLKPENLFYSIERVQKEIDELTTYAMPKYLNSNRIEISTANYEKYFDQFRQQVVEWNKQTERQQETDEFTRVIQTSP